MSQLMRLGPGPGGQSHDHALIPAVPGCAIHHREAVMGAFWQLLVRLPLPSVYSLDDPLFDTASQLAAGGHAGVSTSLRDLLPCGPPQPAPSGVLQCPHHLPGEAGPAPPPWPYSDVALGSSSPLR